MSFCWSKFEGPKKIIIGGLPPKNKNHKAKGFLSNTGPDSMTNNKAIKSAFNVGPTSATSEAPLNGVLLVARFCPFLVLFGPSLLH